MKSKHPHRTILVQIFSTSQIPNFSVYFLIRFAIFPSIDRLPCDGPPMATLPHPLEFAQPDDLRDDFVAIIRMDGNEWRVIGSYPPPMALPTT